MNQKIALRFATVADAKQLLSIYAPYVTHSTVTFEYTVPSLEEFKYRISKTLQTYPYYVALVEGEIVGYAYASAFRTRAAYSWNVETTIYIKQNFHGCGVGSALYAALEKTLKEQGVLTMIACITYPNPPSIAFHQSTGFHPVGHFTQSGYKLEQWVDVIWMEKHIGIHSNSPAPVIPLPEYLKKKHIGTQTNVELT